MFQSWDFEFSDWSESLSRSNLGLYFRYGGKGEFDMLRNDVTKRNEYWEELLSTDSVWNNARNDKQKNLLIKELCYFGIPSHVRGKAWPVLLGNKLRITADLFELLSQQYENQGDGQNTVKIIDGSPADCDVTANNVEKKEFITSESEKTAPENDDSEDASISEPPSTILIHKRDSYLEHIRQDIPRTFPHLAFFHKGGPCEAQLQRVLECYARFRPNVGYVQGMSYLAAMLLLFLEEEPSFKAFCNIVHDHQLYAEKEAMKDHLNLYEDLLEYYLPRTHKHFAHLGVTPEMYALEWVLTLFSNSLPLEAVARVWDCYFFHDSRDQKQMYLWRSVLTLLRLLEPQLLSLVSFSDVLLILRSVRDGIINQETFFDKLKATAISPRLYRSLKEKHNIR